MTIREAIELTDILDEEDRLGVLLIAGFGPLVTEFEELGYCERVTGAGFQTLIELTRAGQALAESFDRHLPAARSGQ